MTWKVAIHTDKIAKEEESENPGITNRVRDNQGTLLHIKKQHSEQ